MKYRIKVKSPNKLFIVNNKPVRSPFQSYTNEDGLCLIKSRIKFYGLTEKEYEIEQLDSEFNQKKDYSYVYEKREPAKTQNKTTDRNITFNNEKLQKDINNPIVKEKQKPTEKPKIQPKIKTIGFGLSTDIEQVEEQIINEDQVNVLDSEVKIEELTVKSSSILEKFLQGEF